MNLSPPVSVDVCLISPGLPSSNPRLLKEAAALSQVGYSVHCVVGDYPTPLREYDEQLLRDAGATFTRIGLGTKVGFKLRRLRQVLAGRLAGRWPSDRLAAWSASTQTTLLQNAASRVPAKLYIGHTLPGLPAAVRAAELRRVLAGFDAEDFHSGETGDPLRDGATAVVERRFLPRTHYRTAAAPLIANAYRQLTGVELETVYNSFPVIAGATPDRRKGQGASPLSVYWFSQTVGPGRGLEQAVRAVGVARSRIRLTLRGIISDRYRTSLEKLASECGLREPVIFAPPAHPDDMIRLAAEHDVGLTIELRQPRNRDLCLTNKLFTYLSAGIPQILSRTSAHEAIMPSLGVSSALVDIESPEQFAAALDAWAMDRLEWERASRSAVELAAGRYAWDRDAERIVNQVHRVIGAPQGSQTRSRSEAAEAIL